MWHQQNSNLKSRVRTTLRERFNCAHRSGALIVLSGLDGAGKSTQIGLLINHLQDKGQYPVYLWTRGGYTTLMDKSKALARHLLQRLLPHSGHSERRTRAFGKGWVQQLWLMLAILDLIRVYGVQIRWWRWRGRSVICDRYIWDTKIDFQLNFDAIQIESWLLWRWLIHITPHPDVSFLLLIPVEESVRRSEIKGEPYRNTIEELTKRRQQYEILAKLGYWKILDGRRSVSELEHEIRIATTRQLDY